MKNPWTIISGYVGFRTFPLPYSARLLDGTNYQLREFYDLETLWQIYFHQVYRVAPTYRCIIDIGANIGLFTCYAARRSPSSKVYAIEPFPATYDRLLAHVNDNRLAGRVRCFPIALCKAPGTVEMSSGSDGSPSQMFHVDQAGTPGGSSISVTADTLAAFLSQVTEPVIDLLKMDIEGSEYEVLMNTPPDALARVARLSVEYHEPAAGVSYTVPDLISHLGRCGLQLRRTTGGDGYGILYFERSGRPE